MRKRRNMETFNLSFLDVVCCGFGAVILLLVITKIYEPISIQESKVNMEELVVELEKQLNELRGESTVLNEEMLDFEEQISENNERRNKLSGDVSSLEAEFKASQSMAEDSDGVLNNLLAAKQELTEEMKRLLVDYDPLDDGTVGGIPVDSEYIIFVIDASGSMKDGAWNTVIEKISETLAVYPEIKGIQVLSDNGDYMFSSYAGKWIPDSREIRRSITRTLNFWQPSSNSNPREGIAQAINAFYAPDRKISIYVFGDDFAGGDQRIITVEGVCRYIAQINKADRFGNRLVRIHGVGFPTRASSNPKDFANLMRKLAEQNGGTFVALPSST